MLVKISQGINNPGTLFLKLTHSSKKRVTDEFTLFLSSLLCFLVFLQV